MKTRAVAAEILRPLVSGERDHVFALTAGQASLVDFLLCGLDAGAVNQISVWTWAIADYELLVMSDVCGRASGITFRLIVDRASVLRQPQFLLWFIDKFGKDSVRATVTHAKICTLEYVSGNVMTIRGSANLNNNRRCEQVDACTTRAVFDVVRGTEDELWSSRGPLKAEDCTYARGNHVFDEIFGRGAVDKSVRMPMV